MSGSLTSCQTVRDALSARLDGEQTSADQALIGQHLPGCAACGAWLSAAEQVTRSTRLQAVAVPDLTGQILAAVAEEQHQTTAGVRAQRAGRRQVLRLALGLSALAQLVLAAGVLLAGLGVTGMVNPHSSREAASFDIALAVGFALAAWRPDRARAFLPVAFVLASCLTLTSAFDIAGGVTALAHEAGHVAALFQAGLLWALSRTATIPEPRRPATVTL